LKIFRADLHIHTCLSPCAELEMSPVAVVTRAVENHLDIIAITDHNSARNIPGVKSAARGKSIKVFYGMEITTKEEVHLLGYFPSLRRIFSFQNTIGRYLADTAEKKIFEEQVIANGKDEVIGFCRKNLFSAVELSIEAIVNAIHMEEGLAVAAHIDREGFGIIGQLGFIPANLELDGAECYDKDSPLVEGVSFPLTTSSDAHRLDDIAKRTTKLHLNEPTFSEFKMAFNRVGLRKVEI
jgi:3',5'-nucleoside bisphosphate phosphatase